MMQHVSPPRPARRHPAHQPVDAPTIDRLVGHFYDAAREDALLGPVFRRVDEADWPAHIARVAAFWRSVLLHDGTYKGNPMRTHAEMPELTAAHFDRWLAMWRTAAVRSCPPVAAMLVIDKAERMAAALIAAHPTASRSDSARPDSATLSGGEAPDGTTA
ncbi:hypothetical protein GCM10011505_29280 [Tistrella bauzanensis]|uniref:Preprotein translocase subunit TatC n=1 Tax=Tistrella bauzanensis TaxID=657419 RepID=A0ABQ1ILB1_9PROT|nr:group III truncated hemoglobin [Tistrella bauzanensis]GGB46263.1 hypothetical protein GCM10011505_29280 [Tistrella bauzanensis]